MNIKPFRDIDEHEVVNLFTLVEGTLSKGNFVGAVSFDLDNYLSVSKASDSQAGTWNSAYTTNATATAATTQTGVIGMTLCDVTGSNPNVWTLQDQYRYFDRIPSGKVVPILKRGLVLINGFVGTAAPGRVGVISTGAGAVAGTISGVAAGTANKVGTFLSATGEDGYALFQVSVI